MPFNVGTGEAVLEQSTPHRLFRGQRDETLTYISRRWDVELLRQPARRASVVCHGDDGVDSSGVAPDCSQCLGQPGSTADGHHPGAAFLQVYGVANGLGLSADGHRLDQARRRGGGAWFRRLSYADARRSRRR